jgi:hypothetical protein
MGYTRLNIDQLALLAVSCVKAIAKPVIYLELFGGWDVASVKDMLDGAFDTMGIQYSQRFWHDSSDTHLDK